MFNFSIPFLPVTHGFPQLARTSEEQLFCYFSSFHLALGTGWIWGREARGRMGAAFTAAEFSPIHFLSLASL